MRTKHLFLAFILSILLIFTACSSGTNGNSSATNAGSQDAYEFMFNSILPNYPETEAMYWLSTGFAEEVAKRSNGQIKINMFYNSQLAPPSQMLDALVSKNVDFILTGPHYYGDLVPAGNLAFLPYWAESPDEAYRLMCETEVGEIYSQDFLDYGAKHIGFAASGSVGFMTTKPVQKVEDLQKMPIRASGGFTNVFYKKLGISGVEISIGEAYDAMQRGVVDGSGGSFTALESMKLGEVVDSIIYPTYLDAQITSIFMNKEKWNELPENLQNIIIETARDMEKKYLELYTKKDEAIPEYLVKYDVQKITFSDEDSSKLFHAGQETWDEFAKLSERNAKIIEVLRKEKGL